MAASTLENRHEEDRVRACMGSWTDALRARDAERIASHYVDDVVVADLAPPLWHVGAATVRKNFEAWFRTWRGPIRCDVRDVHVAVSGDVAWARCLNHIAGPRTNEPDTDMWVRVTVCFRKVDGDWKVEHEHVSVPFYMDGSDRAALDLEP
jgi:uncharacterized protein (TIGR02246 family)